MTGGLAVVALCAACNEERVPYAALVINPDEGCIRELVVEGPPEPGCTNTASVCVSSDDGTCWYFACKWDKMPYEDGTGGSGPPDDPMWCDDSVWFHRQPYCDDFGE